MIKNNNLHNDIALYFMSRVYLREVDVCLTCDVLGEFTGEHPTITPVHLLGYVLKQTAH